MEAQPKAKGSTLLHEMTRDLMQDVLKCIGLDEKLLNISLIPMATGMSLSFIYGTLRHDRPEARYIIMPRIDQKSCIKSIVTAGKTKVIEICLKFML